MLWEWVQCEIVKEGLTEEVASKQGSDPGEPCGMLGEETSGQREQRVQKP